MNRNESDSQSAGPGFALGLEQNWPRAYHSIHPLKACRTLYYEASAVFFREKHFVLGSSSFALEWLRRIGVRNQVNLRAVRFKIHWEFLETTGSTDANASLW